MDIQQSFQKRLIAFSFAGLLIGFSIPVIFLLIDVQQLGIEINFANLYDVFKSQYIYTFSVVFFPISLGIVSALFNYVYTQNIKIQNQEKYINNILNSIVDAIVVVDLNGFIQYANKSFYMNYSSRFSSICQLLDIENLSQLPREHFQEKVLKNKFDETRNVSFIINYSFIPNTLIISIRDIEDLKKNEEIIKSQTAQLFEASKFSALGQMASGFSHEINNPLAIINGKVTICQRELKNNPENFNIDNIQNHLEVCKKMILRITSIIKGLRNLSHAGDEKLTTISIKELVEDFNIMVNMKLNGKNIKFEIDTTTVENESITCNPIQISQVLVNLFNNSMDEIENTHDSWIQFKIEKNDQFFKFSVMDSGHGIPEEVQKKIFEPMFTTKAVGKGTGLGLSITRAIIEKHNGKIIINNKCKNTCFEIYLPSEGALALAA